MELPKQNQDIVTVVENQCFCHSVVKLGAWEATARAQVSIPNTRSERLCWPQEPLSLSPTATKVAAGGEVSLCSH